MECTFLEESDVTFVSDSKEIRVGFFLLKLMVAENVNNFSNFYGTRK
jgi:hypothetical protein